MEGTFLFLQRACNRRWVVTAHTVVSREPEVCCSTQLDSKILLFLKGLWSRGARRDAFTPPYCKPCSLIRCWLAQLSLAHPVQNVAPAARWRGLCGSVPFTVDICSGLEGHWKSKCIWKSLSAAEGIVPPWLRGMFLGKRRHLGDRKHTLTHVERTMV